MKNKFISMLMAVVMSFSLVTGVSAANFSDTVNIPQSEAVDVMETLGITAGYDDGKFHPDDVLTRAQFCTMLTRALYGKPIYTSTIQFKDVPETHWASAFINTAYAHGLMAGYGDGVFGPEDKVTYTQVATILMRVVGYDIDKMTWPAGVNSMANTLELFDNIKIADYAAGCTRAHAAQMIYNAFELNFVNHKSDYPVTIKNKTFLEDALGYVETTKVIDGHEYVAYKDLDDGEIYVTDIRLTHETVIYPVGDGFAYRFKNSSKSYEINWNKIELYVNDTEISTNLNALFANCDKATGVFDDDDNLIAVYVFTDGVDFIYDVVHDTKIYEAVKNDKDFDAENSTVTYFDETGDYIISNKVKFGWVTDAYKSAIYVDGIKTTIDNGVAKFDKGDFVKIFYNYRNEIVAVIDVENPYVYDMDKTTYHTVDCEIWNDTVNRHFHTSVEDINACGAHEGTIKFKVCTKCHAKSGEAHDGENFTLVITK